MSQRGGKVQSHVALTCFSRRDQVLRGAQLSLTTLLCVPFDCIVAAKEDSVGNKGSRKCHDSDMIRQVYSLQYVQQEVEAPRGSGAPNIRRHSLIESSQSLLCPNTLHTVQYATVLRSQVQSITYYIDKPLNVFIRCQATSIMSKTKDLLQQQG